MKIETICMIYRSPVFYEFMRSQGCVDRFVANDPVVEFEGADVYHDPKPNDHYLSRVYRCWNYCVESSDAEYVCLVNSDMAFSDGWLDRLVARLDGKTLPVSRLVEPGFIGVGQHAIEIDLGRDPSDFPMASWRSLAADLSEDRVVPGGLFMPCLLHRETFLRVGRYPEGNVVDAKGRVISGDAYLFRLMENAGYKHVTCFDSLVYHMQEGEMRSAA